MDGIGRTSGANRGSCVVAPERLCRAERSGAAIPAPRIHMVGHIIEAPQVEWKVARDHCIVQTSEHIRGTAVRIGNRYWGEVLESNIERIRWVEALIIEPLCYSSGSGLSQFLTVDGNHTRFGVDINQRIESITFPCNYLGIPFTALEGVESSVRAILAAKGEMKGYRIVGEIKSYGHCVHPGSEEAAVKSVMDALQQQLTAILDEDILGVKYFIEPRN